MRAADHGLEIVQALRDVAVDAPDACLENDARRFQGGVLNHIDELNLGKLADNVGNPLAKMLVEAGRYAQFRDPLAPHLLQPGAVKGLRPGDIIESIDQLAYAIDDE